MSTFNDYLNELQDQDQYFLIGNATYQGQLTTIEDDLATLVVTIGGTKHTIVMNVSNVIIVVN
ncbi:hypothetical protein [Acinetobacter baumannii]|uniref:DUF2642 domain-containing protein n=1 Tax=Acinetobacter baumannii TaxID=470 RepID=A0AAP1QVA8_ACIBA|nr:hypothetical protein [Acinetobacter baumannii]MBD2849099.1 hypothetical protein [Acinetobacter baumannii]MBD3132783.1 hypothetical protein [Acinetobacter baumannii]MBE0306566.1 hypothetical protein [Acinetobacter baumannii]MBE0311872.1 hypothetical protein [Acinetobacter baumannii]MBE0329395.1 hypothetical protein [Acinetobacter baumannii]